MMRRWNSQLRWLKAMSSGKKTVEARLSNKLGDLKPTDEIVFCSGLGVQVYTTVLSIHKYTSFYDMLMAEGVSNVLPGVSTVQEGVKIFHEMYEPSWEQKHGVSAVKFRVYKSPSFSCRVIKDQQMDQQRMDKFLHRF